MDSCQCVCSVVLSLLIPPYELREKRVLLRKLPGRQPVHLVGEDYPVVRQAPDEVVWRKVRAVGLGLPVHDGLAELDIPRAEQLVDRRRGAARQVGLTIKDGAVTVIAV